jgi:hypothetical protein
VAVKLIKVGMDSRQVIARFEAERQALAMMDHPNIAKVLDAGATAAGRPYFIMDLVKGVPITKYCDEHHWYASLPSRRWFPTGAVSSPVRSGRRTTKSCAHTSVRADRWERRNSWQRLKKSGQDTETPKARPHAEPPNPPNPQT